MSDLDTLRPEVREALHRISRDFHISADTDTIRAELLRLTKENARLSGRMCLVCGAANDAACPQRDDTFSPCTFDPSPVDAARDFLRRATKAEAELAALKARIQWQPIETAPKDGTEIMLWVPYGFGRSGGSIELGSYRADDGFSGDDEPQWLDNSYDDFSCGYASCPLSPTHWMPLPPRPEGGFRRLKNAAPLHSG